LNLLAGCGLQARRRSARELQVQCLGAAMQPVYVAMALEVGAVLDQEFEFAVPAATLLETRLLRGKGLTELLQDLAWQCDRRSGRGVALDKLLHRLLAALKRPRGAAIERRGPRAAGFGLQTERLAIEVAHLLACGRGPARCGLHGRNEKRPDEQRRNASRDPC